ncbi:MAG: hypothetical protein Q9205_004226 [Flavoplaca limonia]
MAESLAIAGTAIGHISAFAQVAEKLLRLAQEQNHLERIGLEVYLSLQKLTVWKENWSDQVDNVDLSAKTLWGTQGWSTIHSLLEHIVQLSKTIEPLAQEVHQTHGKQPRLRWKRAVERIGKKGRVDRRQELRKLADELNRSVDELWIYSETAFDSRHGLFAIKSNLTGHGTLIDTALYSRAASLRLYTLCQSGAEDYSLDLDLLGNGSSWKDLLQPRGHATPFHYPLVTEPRKNQIQKLIVEDMDEADIAINDTEDITESTPSDLHLFQPRSGVKVVKVPQHRVGALHYLRIPSTPSEVVQLKSPPESLAKIFAGPKMNYLNDSTDTSLRQGFDRDSKIRLAFTIVRCSFFLLGTPWLSSLNSRNLRRSSHPEDQSSTFILRTQTLELKDLVSDDPGALAETSQLFSLGVLLMEIALATSDAESQSAHLEQHDPKRISKLPLVERAMGASYCKATAYCLQHRTNRFSGPEKYDGKLYTDWETYLAGFLQDYYSQVFLRQVLAFSLWQPQEFRLIVIRLQELSEASLNM